MTRVPEIDEIIHSKRGEIFINTKSIEVNTMPFNSIMSSISLRICISQTDDQYNIGADIRWTHPDGGHNICIKNSQMRRIWTVKKVDIKEM